MMNIFRDLLHSAIRSILLRVKPYFLNSACFKGGKHQVTYKPYKEPCWQDHDLKNMALKRPMSPHLTIFAPTFNAMTSIAQRGTGALMSTYALLLSFGTLFMSNGVETYVSIIQSMNLGSFTIFLLKLLLGFPFCYHYCNGIRYTIWNSGRFLESKEVYELGKKSLIGAAVLTVLFALL